MSILSTNTFAAGSPGVERTTRGFLEALATAAGRRWVAEHGEEIGVDGSRLAVPATASAATWRP